MFTADANLTANFDVDGDGRGVSGDAGFTTATDGNDFTVSGRIDNFRNSAGMFLGTDTMATPNDPVSGGENDWVVLIPSTTIVGNATGALTSPHFSLGCERGRGDGWICKANASPGAQAY